MKATSWPDDFNAFQSGVKDLEVQTQNVMTSAMDGAENSSRAWRCSRRSVRWPNSTRGSVRGANDDECFDAFASGRRR